MIVRREGCKLPRRRKKAFIKYHDKFAYWTARTLNDLMSHRRFAKVISLDSISNRGKIVGYW